MALGIFIPLMKQAWYPPWPESRWLSLAPHNMWPPPPQTEQPQLEEQGRRQRGFSWQPHIYSYKTRRFIKERREREKEKDKWQGKGRVGRRRQEK